MPFILEKYAVVRTIIYTYFWMKRKFWKNKSKTNSTKFYSTRMVITINDLFYCSKCGLVFDLFFQNFLFVQNISTNNCPNNCRFFLEWRAWLTYISNEIFFSDPYLVFSWVAFIYCFFLHIFCPIGGIRTKIIYLDVK